METIGTTIITTLIGLVIGYLANLVRTYKKRENSQCKALKALLKSTLTNQYYVYQELKKVPFYVKESWYAMYEEYRNLGGNSFIKDDIKPKWDKLESVKD